VGHTTAAVVKNIAGQVEDSHRMPRVATEAAAYHPRGSRVPAA